jgi:hypothetical protein
MGEWRIGRGSLGPLQPLMGCWRSEPAADGPASAMPCVRTFSLFGVSWVHLEAAWGGEDTRQYREIAIFGKGGEGLEFWSFTSDGKRSQGALCDGTDVHPKATAFQAQMPAGTARMIYWPADAGEGFYFAVESRTKNGWNRFLRHRYRPA